MGKGASSDVFLTQFLLLVLESNTGLPKNTVVIILKEYVAQDCSISSFSYWKLKLKTFIVQFA